MSQYYAQVYVDHQKPGVGHVAVVLTDANGNSDVYGYYPEGGRSTILDVVNKIHGPGDVRINYDKPAMMEGKSARIEITKNQYDAMKNYIRGVGDNPNSKYSLKGDLLRDSAGLNCATFARRVLDAGGVAHPNIEVHPYEYLPYSVVERGILDNLLSLSRRLANALRPLDSILNKLNQASTINPLNLAIYPSRIPRIEVEYVS